MLRLRANRQSVTAGPSTDRRDLGTSRLQKGIQFDQTEVKRARAIYECVGAIVIVGAYRNSGKSRLAWELLHSYSDALVVVPKAYEPPHDFVPTGLRDRSVILLFDDLHFVAAVSHPLAWRDRIASLTRQCLIVCTSEDGAEWESFRRGQAALLRRYEKGNHDSSVIYLPSAGKNRQGSLTSPTVDTSDVCPSFPAGEGSPAQSPVVPVRAAAVPEISARAGG